MIKNIRYIEKDKLKIQNLKDKIKPEDDEKKVKKRL